MSFLPQVPVLDGSLVRLEPLSLSHAGDLAAAAGEDRGAYGFTVVPRAWEVREYVAAHAARARDGMLEPFAQVRQHDGRAVGVTAYWDPRLWPDRSESHADLRAVDIGWTWLAASAQRTGINTEAKLLLMEHAFETLGVIRVGFSVDARNERSRRAVERLGAHFEGVLRLWSPSRAPGEEGLLRDSALFSVIAAEWPATKAALCRRLAGQAPAGPPRDESACADRGRRRGAPQARRRRPHGRPRS
jgi:N-acetyltransferase